MLFGSIDVAAEDAEPGRGFHDSQNGGVDVPPQIAATRKSECIETGIKGLRQHAELAGAVFPDAVLEDGFVVDKGIDLAGFDGGQTLLGARVFGEEDKVLTQVLGPCGASERTYTDPRKVCRAFDARGQFG